MKVGDKQLVMKFSKSLNIHASYYSEISIVKLFFINVSGLSFYFIVFSLMFTYWKIKNALFYNLMFLFLRYKFYLLA